MSRPLFSRYQLFAVILLCYLTPLAAFFAYHAFSYDSTVEWQALGMGILILSAGSLTFFVMAKYWELKWLAEEKEASQSGGESKVEPIGIAVDPEEFKFNKLALEEAQQAQVRLLSEIDLLTDEIKKISSEAQRGRQEAEKNTLTAAQQLEQQQRHIRELQEAVAEQKALVEKKQQQVVHLETKVGDLTYEIKTLLKFAEAHSGSLQETPEEPNLALNPPKPLASEPVRMPASAALHPSPSMQLKKYIDIAQRITGSQRFGSQLYSFLDSPAESFALDLRRLCDRLRTESGAILLYSPTQGQVLFTNNQVKELCGWSPEKFTQNFSEILCEEAVWVQAVSALSMQSEVQTSLPLRTKDGEIFHVQANLGIVPTGIFRNHVLAVLHVPALDAATLSPN